MTIIPFHIEELLEDFPSVDLLAHPASVEGRWEAVLILSEDGDSLFLRKGKPLTGLQQDVGNSCKIINSSATLAWIDESDREQDLIVILGRDCKTEFTG